MGGVDLSTLLEGALGGAGVLLLSVFYGRIETARNRRREREGLLRIIDAEVYENNRLLRVIRENPDLAKYPSLFALSTDAWDQCRTRLSELLSKDQDHVFVLVRHYALVVRIRALLEDPDALAAGLSRKERRGRTVRERVADAEGERHNLLSTLANRALSDGEEVRRKGERYIGALPDYYAVDEGQSATEPTEDG